MYLKSRRKDWYMYLGADRWDGLASEKGANRGSVEGKWGREVEREGRGEQVKQDAERAGGARQRANRWRRRAGIQHGGGGGGKIGRKKPERQPQIWPGRVTCSIPLHVSSTPMFTLFCDDEHTHICAFSLL
eukprot:6193763-Pleurochrysis_carterae.AAC.1